MTALPFGMIVGRLHWRLAALRFQLAWAQYETQQKALHHSNFQPRVSAGNPDGGQFAPGEVGGGRLRVAVRDPRLIMRLLERVLRPRAGQSRSDVELARRALDVFTRVREIDPGWLPAIDGEVTSTQSIIDQAERRLAGLGRLSPEQLIERYRTENRMPDMFGHPAWPEDKGTVAVAVIDGMPVFGVNARAPTHRSSDKIAAENLRNLLVEKYPDVMQVDNIGQMPNDAVSHAETTVLLRAARSNGGSLRGQELQIHVDRPMCDSCNRVLPLIARELGNPTITYIGPKGQVRILRDGRWERAGGR